MWQARKEEEKGLNLFAKANNERGAQEEWRGRAHYQAIVSGVFFFHQNRDWSELLNIPS